MQEMMEKRRQGIKCGIPSYCTANELPEQMVILAGDHLGPLTWQNLPLEAKELAMDGVTNFMLDYEYAVTL